MPPLTFKTDLPLVIVLFLYLGSPILRRRFILEGCSAGSCTFYESYARLDELWPTSTFPQSSILKKDVTKQKCTDKSRMNRSITKFLSLCVLVFHPWQSLCFPFNCVLGSRRQLSTTRPCTIPSTCSDHEQITARCEDVQRKSAATELPRRRPLRTDLLWEEYKSIHTTVQPHQEVLNSDQWHFTKEYHRQLSRIRVKQKVINVLHPSTTRANTTLKANHQSNQVVRLHQDFRPSTIFCKNLTRQLIFVHHQQSNWTRQISNFQQACVHLHFHENTWQCNRRRGVHALFMNPMRDSDELWPTSTFPQSSILFSCNTFRFVHVGRVESSRARDSTWWR